MATGSTMLPLGTKAPDFALPDVTSGKIVKLTDLANSPVLLVAFLCRHCPYVQHIKEEMANLARDYQPRGVAVIGISSNDATAYPDDAPESLRQFAQQEGWTFPFLYDESQAVAKEFSAACTPDFFLFNQDRELVYRGQLDDSRPGSEIPVTGIDLRTALDAVLENRPGPSAQRPAIGCSIKWKN